MFTGLFRILFVVLLLMPSIVVAQEPDELSAKLDELNLRIFDVNANSLDDQQRILYDEIKGILADVQLNINFGNYPIAEELLVIAEGKIDELNILTQSAISSSGSGFVSGFLIFSAILLVVGAIAGFTYFSMTRKKTPTFESLLEPTVNDVSSEVAKPVNAERCPDCNGKMHNGVCVWCAYDEYKRQN